MYKYIIVLISLNIFSPAQALDAGQFPAYEAHYDLYKKGISVANTSIKLRHIESGIEFSSYTYLTGFAAWLGDNKVREKSLLSNHNDILKLNSYEYIQQGDTEAHIQINLEQKNKIATTSIDKELIHKTPFETVLWDKLSVTLDIMQFAKNTDVSGTIKNHSFNIINDGKIINYVLQYKGQREIELDDDEWVMTQRWQSQRLHSKRKKIFYLAPSMNYLPALIEQYKNEKLHTVLRLKQVNW